MKYEYLFFNFIILVSSCIGVVLSKKGIWPQRKNAILSILTISIPYILWDQCVTGYWWSFNHQFISGFRIGSLPIEEILFFFIIPWSCLIIWENIKNRIPGIWNFSIVPRVTVITIVIGFVSLIGGWWYTLMMSILVLALTIIASHLGQTLQKKAFLFFLCIVCSLTIIFNGYLTARPVVMYNQQVLSGMRIGTIPLEDIFYGLALVGGIVVVYDRKKCPCLQIFR